MSILFAAPIEQFPRHLEFASSPTCSVADANFPAANLRSMDPTHVLKTTGPVATINWDFGAAREFDVVALLHNSLSYKALWVISASTDGSVYTTLAASNPAAAHLESVPGSWSGEINDPRRSVLLRNKSFWVSPTVRTFRYLRILVTGDATLDPTFTAGRLFVGKKFVPSTGWQYGSSIGFQDLSPRERSDRGVLLTDPRDPIITASVKMEFLNKTELMDHIYEFNYWRGSGREFFACLDVEDVARLQKNILYCTITEGRTITFDAFNTHSQTWILESIA